MEGGILERRRTGLKGTGLGEDRTGGGQDRGYRPEGTGLGSTGLGVLDWGAL